ncbi:MAG: hypothetical protein PVI01_13305 [Gemmatimonadales bacterium]|jgi:hypothetical protein
MNDERIDFSGLDPTQDAERFGAIVRSIAAAAAGELAARRARASVVGQVASWWRPLLAAAAIVGIVSIGALARLGTSTATAETEAGLAEAIGMPQQIAEWVLAEDVPTPTELLVVLEGDG